MSQVLFFSFLVYSMLQCQLMANDPSTLTTIKQAERLFAEKLYGDAIPLYSSLLSVYLEEEGAVRDQLILRLATCYLKEEHSETALDLLNSLEIHSYRSLSFYLMSIAHRQKGESAQALAILHHCLASHTSQPVESLIILEKGYHLFKIGDLMQAKDVFTTISWQKQSPLPYYFAQLYLARIHFLEKNFNAMHHSLHLLAHYLSPQHPLNIERLYLKALVFLVEHQDTQAIECFEQLLPKALVSKAAWPIQVYKGLAICYLRQALTLNLSSNQLKDLFFKADIILQQLIARAPIEASYLLLSDFYLIKAKRLNDAEAYLQIQQLLDKEEFFSSEEGKKHALLKRAESLPSYKERDYLYQQLVTIFHKQPSFCAKIWSIKGLDHFEEALKCQKLQTASLINWHFEQAAQAFAQAASLYETLNTRETALALKYLILSYAQQSGQHKARQAWEILDHLLGQAALVASFENPQEIYCLAGWVAFYANDKDILRHAQSFLRQCQMGPFLTTWGELALRLEGLLLLQLEEWEQADALFARLLQEEAHSTSHGEAWFWRAYCADRLQKAQVKSEYLQQVYHQDPQSPFAPIAYFHFYSYREYMRGQRKAIKHLHAMPLLFPSHPLLVTAHYLIGLDHKKDHLSENGQVLRRKDLTAAIEAFQLAESTFDELFEKKLIPLTDIPYFMQVRYYAQLERAQANLAMAQQSKGGKRQIYLEYAEGMFKQLIQDFLTPGFILSLGITDQESYPKVWAEAEFKLAQIYEEKEQWEKAIAILDQSLDHYRKAPLIQSHHLMRVWYQKGKIAQKCADFATALQDFLEAEKVNQNYLGISPDEKLDLWIQQSLCYKELHQLEEAMRLLSRVINDDVISALRIKAMFLRTEIYELQGRPELALKQLEATARKGGEWALKAQEKLEQMYGY